MIFIVSGAIVLLSGLFLVIPFSQEFTGQPKTQVKLAVEK